METQILLENQIDEAAALLKNEEVVCFPTETVYGIGVTARTQKAFDRLVIAKHRPPDKPFTLMCSSLDEAYSYCLLGERQKAVMSHFMPGEITVLVLAKEGLDHWVTLGTPIIGIRIPNSAYVLSLIKKVGYPCLVTSANHSGEKTSTSFEETLKTFQNEVAAVVKGSCTSKLASTIVDISSPDGIKLIRQGSIPFEEIEKVWEDAK